MTTKGGETMKVDLVKLGVFLAWAGMMMCMIPTSFDFEQTWQWRFVVSNGVGWVVLGLMFMLIGGAAWIVNVIGSHDDATRDPQNDNPYQSPNRF